MDFISNKTPQIEAMLAEIGIQKIEELFASIPASLIIKPPAIDDGLSEYEGLRLMEDLAARNTFSSFDSYLGAGAYEHHVPALVGAVCSKSEFLTAYTPYQAEASQGMLQIIFEFQSAICALTGMDVANASVYDGASACAEAMLMALRHSKGRSKLLIADTLHPHYKGVIEQYLKSQNCQIEFIPYSHEGILDEAFLKAHLDEQTAAVIVQSPNFCGTLEDVKRISAAAKEKGALSILCANPIAYGLFASAAEQGADIAVGDCQPLGLSLSFGGPYAGYMACRQELVRQLPGRIVGETVDTQGRRGFVLTLQAREQHIRREKATSNICTNQALAALASLVAILWYGKEGMKALALTNYQRTAYLKQQLSQLPGIKVWNRVPSFNEFVVDFKRPVTQVVEHFRQAGIEPGIELRRYFPALETCLLLAVTETKSQEQLDRFVRAAKELV
ncbi:glycine cleavage system P-protein subunit 1 [Candidatus Protochlamydia naegleriophila]|uniref:Probable glycine dehydrogenase (decarboxylating) subunit 1 n=1 Tax=Candidatus Protochlamydia naegleriophila TaxID=389348 RepID=A0A0U5JFP8_9BACT|nr:aminomethyl-transferring glycine dehydrogenase subunit GcvPA [Candidatus Protochlamydia naegleriophila]CUI17636.1 glycine cleavage system P-protein subunit 1 [Candidatus Protochlamydia naegleriophila]